MFSEISVEQYLIVHEAYLHLTRIRITAFFVVYSIQRETLSVGVDT